MSNKELVLIGVAVLLAFYLFDRAAWTGKTG